MFQVEIKDFQSIDHVSLTLKGFTTLVGKTNIGKSAVVRALQCALTNGSGTYFVRHGESCAKTLRGSKTCKCHSSVHIRGESFDLLWEKGDSVNRYTFNKEVYDSPGTGIPDFLVEAGFGPVKVGSSATCIQVADQFKPLFLLDQSGPAIAETISDVSGLDRINKATKVVEKDKRESIATKRVREKDILDLTLGLSRYSNLGSLKSEVISIESQLRGVETVTQRTTALVGYSEKLPLLEEATTRLSVVNDLVLSDPKEIVAQSKSLQLLVAFVARLRFCSKNLSSLLWVEDFSGRVPDLDAIKPPLEVLRRIVSWIQSLRGFKTTLPNLDKVSKVEVPSLNLEGRVEPIRVVEGYFRRLTALEKSLVLVEAKLSSAVEELGQVELEFESLGVCPTCSQALHAGMSHG